MTTLTTATTTATRAVTTTALRTRLSALALTSCLALSGCGAILGEGDDDGGGGGGGGTAGSTAPEPSASTSATEQEPEQEPDDRAPAEVLEAAADATVATRRFTIASSAELEIATQELRFSTDGRIDYDVPVSETTIAVDQDGATQEVTILSDGESLWVAAEGTGVPAFPDGATYLEGDATQLAEDETFTPEDLLGVVYVTRSGAEATEEGTEEVDGVETRRYAWTTTYAEAETAAGEDAEAFRTAFALTGEGARSDLAVEAWVGPDDVVRRLAIDVQAPPGIQLDGTYDLELSDVGEEVAPPAAPADDEVARGPEAEALLEQLLAG
ncbi:hypothetical protein [Nocardioides litoris]|uniref:hypothetical protein n=1 Tax=Nocardioides litoris TaxID=1926648 RepID=UPI00111FA263|nr:hypothetical protein [Nocardioides litoris]